MEGFLPLASVLVPSFPSGGKRPQAEESKECWRGWSSEGPRTHAARGCRRGSQSASVWLCTYECVHVCESVLNTQVLLGGVRVHWLSNWERLAQHQPPLGVALTMCVSSSLCYNGDTHSSIRTLAWRLYLNAFVWARLGANLPCRWRFACVYPVTGYPLYLTGPYPLQSPPSLGQPFWGHFANTNAAAAGGSQKGLQPT